INRAFNKKIISRVRLGDRRIQAIRNSPGIGDERGFITVNSRYQHLIYKNIYAADVAVKI
ncbi:MAG: hypothetical protein WA421_05815, partial [Nitrososphaeraceae archaeon]